ncbi:MAG: aquaporin [Ornithinimicrobium sp.]|uniref:aquaporin n=1 Tax=Ornithinimicrobium sp. TaxID=1977084 RepID=UPI003D9AC166
MPARPALRRVAAEALGTGVLLCAIVGSGIMAANLTQDVALQLLINALSTIAALGVMIWALGPISGAHFNPAVTLVALSRRELPVGEAASYVVAQVLGGLAGAAVANLMFTLPALHPSTQARDTSNLWLGEVVATAGLIGLIGALTRSGNGRLGPIVVPAWIGAGYFFTSSTSFANPAVTIARSLTDTFSGIAPAGVAAFITAQLGGAVIGALLTELFYPCRGIPESLDLSADATPHTPPARSRT